MKRLFARRATLLVALYLLASAATAYAECAWVLWSNILDTRSGAETHDVHSALPTRQECDVAVRAAAAVLRTKGYDVSGGFPGSYEALGTKGTRTWRYYCLPDTIDPRGPKAK